MQWTTLLLLLKAENCYVHGKNLQGKTVRERFKTTGTSSVFYMKKCMLQSLDF